MPAPAFTSVITSRHNLDPPHMQSPAHLPSESYHKPHQTMSSPQKLQWPAETRDYVARCFASENEIPGISADEVKSKLSVMLTEIHARNELWTTQWQTMPLPQQLILNERRAAASIPPPSQVGLQSNHLSASYTQMNAPVAPPTITLTNSKKRKSSEISQDESPQSQANPPWRIQKSQGGLEDRVTHTTPAQSKRMEKRQRKLQHAALSLESSKSLTDLEKRRQRFDGNKGFQSPTLNSSRDDTPMSDAPEGPVVGTCQELEKKYFRLTSAPKPETVRPLPVLEKTLELLKSKWKKEANYSYICDQFKSLRQDLTVQHIKTEFTVKVYELHARIALEKGDLGEYNQCQTQLRALYRQNLGGHPAEFLAYRILYIVYTGNRTDMNDVLADLAPSDRLEPAVKHALAVRSALALGNYHRFFRLFLDAPSMGAYLIDMFVVRERLAALANICKAYKSALKMSFLTEELGFDSEDLCAAFICDHGGEALLDSNNGEVLFAANKAGQHFENAKRAAFKRVDIKGQI